LRRGGAGEIAMKNRISLLVAALAAGAALAAAPLMAEARPGGGGGGGGSNAGGGNWHGGGGQWHGGGYRGGYWHGGYRGWYGGYRGWYGWGYRPYWGVGYWPGYYWPGYYWGVAAGTAAVAYAAPYYNYYGGYYGYPAAPVAEYVVSEPPSGDRVVRSGQPVPQAPPPDPIFYPRNGQSAAQTEADRQDCNRWATTQQNALSDAQVFQRATYACMEGRGYTVR
jgi:hypothetical protein